VILFLDPDLTVVGRVPGHLAPTTRHRNLYRTCCAAAFRAGGNALFCRRTRCPRRGDTQAARRCARARRGNAGHDLNLDNLLNWSVGRQDAEPRRSLDRPRS
jgi:hypothetical protein